MTPLEYLLTLTPEQAAEAVKLMSPEAKSELIVALCTATHSMLQSIVHHKDQIWESR